VIFSYSDVFDRQPTKAELIALVEKMPLRHAIFVLSRINLALRYAMQGEGRTNFGKVQELLIAAHIDDEILGALKARFPTVKCDDRPDLAFVVEKCHTGVQWAIHDKLPTKRRQTVFNAWGVLFEEYVHWLLEGMRTDLPIRYIRAPKWRNTNVESFDGILLQGDVLMPAEYKGGFLSRSARYSGNSKDLLKELDAKFATGCDQLADKIGALFTEEDIARKELEELPLDHIRSIVPVLVLQDHIFRVPFLNWYLNKKFQERLRRSRLRAGVFVRAAYSCQYPRSRKHGSLS